MRIPLHVSGVICALLACLSASVPASVTIHGTRVIFPSDEDEVTIRTSNEGSSPGLVQLWVDKGNPQTPPHEIDVPFLLTPPRFRIDAGKGQSIRMIYTGAPASKGKETPYTGEPLSKDKETLFWLNLLEIPPRPANAAEINYMQMAFRTRIKIFFRPQHLHTQELVYAAPPKITWRLVHEAGKYLLEAKNPTPYYISVTRVGLVKAGEAPDAKPEFLNEEGGMLAPGGEERYVLKDLQQAPAADFRVRFTYLNDYGGIVSVDNSYTQ